MLFHSHQERNLRENLFDELSTDRALQSAVFARSADFFDAKYWGVEHRVYTRPIAGTTWTIVVLLDKTMLWTLNLETFTGAIILFVAYLLGLVLWFLFLCRKTHLTAPWAWPDESKVAAYRQLTVVYVFTAVILFLIQKSDEHLSHALVSVLLLSILVILLTYIRLNDPLFKKCSGWKKKPIYYIILGVVVVWALAVILNPHDDLQGSELSSLVPHLLLDLCLFGIGFGFIITPRCDKVYQKLTSEGYRTSYVLGMLALALLTSVYPASIFFRMSHNVQSELFVKYAQLNLGRSLEQRTERIRESYSKVMLSPQREEALQRLVLESRGVYAGIFFGTTFNQNIAPDSCGCRSRAGQISEDLGKKWLFHLLTAPYSEASTEMRELLHTTSADSSIIWLPDTLRGRKLLLHLEDAKRQDTVHLWTPVPRFGEWNILSRLTFWTVLLLSGLLYLLFVLVKNVAQQFFLIDVTVPGQDGLADILRRKIESNILVLNTTRDSVQPLLGTSSVHILDLAQTSWDKIWVDVEGVPSLPADKVIVVDHFEYRMHDSPENCNKLRLLELLIYTYGRTVVLVSTVDPLFEFSFGRPPEGQQEETHRSDELERWKSVLGTCMRVFVMDKGHHEEVLESSRARYHRLWATCSGDERRVLLHVAVGGFVSPKNQAVVSALLQRGLLARTPNLRVMNKTFGTFLMSEQNTREVARLDARSVRTGWSSMRVPFLLLLLGAALFLFITQQAVLNTTMAFISTAAALLPALFRLFGMLTEGNAVQK